MKSPAILTLALALEAALPVAAEVVLPAMLADHMVVQRGVPIHVWGWASPGETVHVEFRGESASAVADDLGVFSAYLEPSAAGGPFSMTVRGANTIVLNDVQVGDVWMAAGQSNMQFELRETDGSSAEIAVARHPGMRFFHVTKTTSPYPLEDVFRSGWAPCTPANAPRFSAVAYFFAREIHERIGVPIGVIDASWGGKPLVSFTSLAAIGKDPALMPVVAQWAQLSRDESARRRMFEQERRDFDRAAALAKAAGRGAPVPRFHKRLDGWAPGTIFNGMIAPVTPFPIRGVIWYQGESDASPERVPVYARLFKAMIRDWREQWGIGEFPFLFVQLHNWTAEPNSAWPELREAQAEALALPRTGMAVAIDVGDANEVHPHDKKTVGARLALAARAVAYGEAVEHSGPVFRQLAPDSGALRVSFDHAEGLAFRGTGPRGFEIAGADGRYVSADARIEGPTVVLSSREVPAPRSARYAWADNPAVSLYNAQGLPAPPFRAGPTQ